MSAGNHGMGGHPPENDDPFGYLYRPDGQQAGGAPQAPPQPTYNQVRPVGERTYGGHQGHGSNGYGQHGYQQQGNPHYAAPETQPGGAGYGGRSGQGAHGDDPGPRRNGLLIGAIAVVAAVVIGVGAAILFSGGDEDGDRAGGDATPTAGSDAKGGDDEDEDGTDEQDEEEPEEEPEELPSVEVTALELSNGARLDSSIDGARSADGSYVTDMNLPGATLSWTFDFEGEPGDYRLYVGYSLPKGDQALSFAVNTQIRDDKLSMEDYAKNDDWAKNWVRTFRIVNLDQGQNTIHIGCDQGDKCDVIIDQIWIAENAD